MTSAAADSSRSQQRLQQWRQPQRGQHRDDCSNISDDSGSHRGNSRECKQQPQWRFSGAGSGAGGERLGRALVQVQSLTREGGWHLLDQLPPPSGPACSLAIIAGTAHSCEVKDMPNSEKALKGILAINTALMTPVVAGGSHILARPSHQGGSQTWNALAQHDRQCGSQAQSVLGSQHSFGCNSYRCQQ